METVQDKLVRTKEKRLVIKEMQKLEKLETHQRKMLEGCTSIF